MPVTQNTAAVEIRNGHSIHRYEDGLGYFLVDEVGELAGTAITLELARMIADGASAEEIAEVEALSSWYRTVVPQVGSIHAVACNHYGTVLVGLVRDVEIHGVVLIQHARRYSRWGAFQQHHEVIEVPLGDRTPISAAERRDFVEMWVEATAEYLARERDRLSGHLALVDAQLAELHRACVRHEIATD
jgi:hypothetical protein